MTAKEKAKDLIDKYFIVIDNSHPLEDILKTAKKCALIAVDELIRQEKIYNNGIFYHSNYWQEVKQEIQNL